MSDATHPHPSLADERIDYRADRLLESEAPADPYVLFDAWLTDAFAAKTAGLLPEPTAMVLATTDGRRPSSRTVLLKAVEQGGFVFYTNYGSRKGTELAANPYAALHFGWYPQQRQVRVEGPVSRVDRDETERYFASRPRGSQLGAWASAQSSEIASADELDASYRAAEERFAGSEVPCPEGWGGFRLTPDLLEFWQGRPSRLHDRLRYTPVPGGWARTRLAP
ncbi:MAG: pdxH [Friedmanniella sp.]|nr:pdxH [Friedmanniella sp.]